MQDLKKLLPFILPPTHSPANIYCLLRQSNSHVKTIEKVQALSLWFTLLPVDDAVMTLALNSSFKDFEDAILHYSVIHQKEIKHIVTRNKKDFKYGNLTILTPKELIQTIKTNP